MADNNRFPIDRVGTSRQIERNSIFDVSRSADRRTQKVMVLRLYFTAPFSISIGDGVLEPTPSANVSGKVLWHVTRRGVLRCFERLHDLICSPSQHDTYHRRPHGHPGSPPGVCGYSIIVAYGLRYVLVGDTDEFK